MRLTAIWSVAVVAAILNAGLLVSANEGYPVSIIHLNDFHAR